MKYYIIAGEPSGDLHGAKLIEGLKRADSEASFRFWGGDLMAEAGRAANLVKHYRETSFFGFVNVLKNLRTIRRQFAECHRDITTFRPDVVILIDYPGFNLKIARWAKEQGLTVFYYIAPKAWAWKEHRVKQIKRYVDRLYTIFPFETEWFGQFGIEPHFCGNPLSDDIALRRKTLPTREAFLAKHHLDERPIVALVAGSRPNEIRENLPDMVALSKRFPTHQFIVTAVPWLDRALYDREIEGSEVRYLCGETQQILAMSDAAIVTSGTATLETALMGIPEMVLYHIPKLYEVLRPYVLKIPFVSLVNINLGREAVRELVCCKIEMQEAEAELRSILPGGSKRAKMLSDFAELQQLIGGEGASDRFAEQMVKHLKEQRAKRS